MKDLTVSQLIRTPCHGNRLNQRKEQHQIAKDKQLRTVFCYVDYYNTWEHHYTGTSSLPYERCALNVTNKLIRITKGCSKAFTGTA